MFFKNITNKIYFYIIVFSYLISINIISSEFINNNTFLLAPVNGRQIEEENGCRYRDHDPYPEKIFSYLANAGCYNYARQDLFSYRLTTCWINQIPMGLMLNNNECIPFDNEDPLVKDMVKLSYNNLSTYYKWQECCDDASFCCMNVLKQHSDKETHCPAVWDGWTCFFPQPISTTQERVCSPYFYGEQLPECNHYSNKECFNNGSWNTNTDYSTCARSPRIIQRTKWHIGMLSISIIACLPAIFIFIIYQSLRVQKYFLLRNLLVVIVLRNTFIIITKSTIVMDELTNADVTIMDRNSGACKFLAFLECLSTNAFFACMLLVGIYIHQLLSNVFASRRHGGAKLLPYYIGFGSLSTLSSIIWAILMAVYADEHCWLVVTSYKFHWINDVPRICMLTICSLLFCHLIWLIWRTYRNKLNENHSLLRTAKAFIFCMPLFGISYLFFLVYPNTKSCAAEQSYFFISYLFDGLQGLFIAILQCFLDREVIKLLKRTFGKTLNYVGVKIGKKSNTENSSPWMITSTNRSTHFTSIDDEKNNTNDHNLNITDAKNTEHKYLNLQNNNNNNNIGLISATIPEAINYKNSEIKILNSNEQPINSDSTRQGFGTGANEENESEVIINPAILFRNRADGIIVADK